MGRRIGRGRVTYGARARMDSVEEKNASDTERGQRAEWMGKAQAGDRDAYRTLLNDIHADLIRFVRRRVHDPQEVEDIVQDVLLMIHRARHTYDASRPFEPWMYAIARNTTIDHGRKRSTRGKREVLTGELPEVAAGAETSDAPLAAALEQLPDAQREAFSMLKIEGLSVEAAAERAGVSAGTLRVRAHRSYRFVKAFIGHEDERDGEG